MLLPCPRARVVVVVVSVPAADVLVGFLVLTDHYSCPYAGNGS